MPRVRLNVVSLLRVGRGGGAGIPRPHQRVWVNISESQHQVSASVFGGSCGRCRSSMQSWLSRDSEASGEGESVGDLPTYTGSCEGEGKFRVGTHGLDSPDANPPLPPSPARERSRAEGDSGWHWYGVWRCIEAPPSLVPRIKRIEEYVKSWSVVQFDMRRSAPTGPQKLGLQGRVDQPRLPRHGSAAKTFQALGLPTSSNDTWKFVRRFAGVTIRERATMPRMPTS